MRPRLIFGACVGIGLAAFPALAQRSGPPAHMASSAQNRTAPSGSLNRGRLVVFAEPNFRGRSIVLTQSESDLSRAGFHQPVLSFRTDGQWTVCQNVDFRPPCRGVRANEARVSAQLTHILSARPGR